VVVHCGATPVFVDVSDDFNIDVDAIRKAITKNTKVIMPVDFGGWPCKYTEINSLVLEDKILKLFDPTNENQHRLGRILILSDAAHSIGASYRGRKTGSLTDVSVFSFHAVKNLTTAEGGAISLNLPEAFDSDEVYRCLNIKILHGQNKDALAKLNPGAWKYDIVEAGYKYNMTDILASIGLVELERYDTDTLLKRKEIVHHYNQLLNKYSWANLPVIKSDEAESSYHLIIEQISLDGISVNVHFIPVPMMSYYKSLNYNIADYPNSYNNYKAEISLPVFYDLEFSQIEEIVKALYKAIKRLKI
jgi:dTDP-4-amino-4,6-dideoxygalactose transaminase